MIVLNGWPQIRCLYIVYNRNDDISFVCLFVCLCLFVYLFVCMYVCLFVYLFVCLLYVGLILPDLFLAFLLGNSSPSLILQGCHSHWHSLNQPWTVLWLAWTIRQASSNLRCSGEIFVPVKHALPGMPCQVILRTITSSLGELVGPEWFSIRTRLRICQCDSLFVECTIFLVIEGQKAKSRVSRSA